MNEEPRSTDIEEDLSAVLVACLETEQDGRPVDRQELLARYPQFADELARFFTQWDGFDLLAAPLREAVQGASTDIGDPDLTLDEHPGPTAQLTLSSFGDYEILEELGRGGMGVVCKARQKSLNRLVALKVLRSDPLAPPEDRQRFQNEAALIAEFDHPGIVPIYEVGECPQGLYFTMRLLAGGTLGQQLGQYRNNPRAVGQIMAEVARAVHHAHQRGVLHRDLKPSNVLLDGEGRPHVADFGLARRVGGDGDLTQSGTLVGTPNYMAPEQASGRRGAVTTATDVHGLGAVLYALLTSHAPFQGENVLDTLQQVREREPASPRSINPIVDQELETICLKCLDKEPARRYGSAEAVADELDRWLRGEPIQARPIGKLMQGWRWCRRNPLVASLLAFSLLSLLSITVVALVSYVLLAEKQVRTDQALENEKREYQRAEQALEKEAQQHALARKRAHEARQAADAMYTEFAKEWFVGKPRLQKKQREFMEKALQFYQNFSAEDEQSNDPAVRFELASAYQRVGHIQLNLGNLPKAEAALVPARDLYDRLVNDVPDEPRYRAERALLWYQLACLYGDRGAPAQEEAAARASVAHWKELVLTQPIKRHLSSAQSLLAGILSQVGKAKESEETHRAALATLSELPPSISDAPAEYSCRASCLYNLAVHLAQQNRVGEAEPLLRECLRILKHPALAEPEPGPRSETIAQALHVLGDLLAMRGRNAEAKAVFDEAVIRLEELVSRYPDVRDLSGFLAGLYQSLAQFCLSEGDPAKAELVYRKWIALQKKLTALRVPAHPDFSLLGAVENEVAVILIDRGDLAPARQLLEEAISHQRIALDAEPRHPTYREYMRNHYRNLAKVSRLLGDHAGAVRALQEPLRLFPDRGDEYVFASVIIRRCAETAERDTTLKVEQRRQLAQEYRDKARSLVQEALKRKVEEPGSQNNLAWVLADGPFPELRDPARALGLARTATARNPKRADYWHTFGTAYYRTGDWKACLAALDKAQELKSGGTPGMWLLRAMALWQLQDREQARTWYRRAVAQIEKESTTDADLARSRAEAAALLGVPDRIPAKQKEFAPSKP
jgi:serine/threonine-protein kinase